MITITYPGGRVDAWDAEEAADQVMGRQAFGAYPLWSWDDDARCWLRYDGAEDDGRHCPRASVEDLRDYAAWSLGARADQVRITVSGGDPLHPTGAEVTAARETLGLTLDEFAAIAGVNPQTPRRWEAGREPVALRIGELLAELAREHATLVERLIEAADGTTATRAAVVVPRTQEEYKALYPEADRPLRWLRIAAALAASTAPRLRIVRDAEEAARLGAEVIHPLM